MRTALIAVSLLSFAVSPATGQDDESGGREEFTAVALSAGGVRSAPVAAQLEIVIDRWSTTVERERLMATLGKGQRTTLEELQDLPRVGYVRTPGSLGWSLHYAHETRGEDGGRRIFLATDRPISIAEAIDRPRTIEYPFTFIELQVNDAGEGQGSLSFATRLTASRDGRFVYLEHWDTPPIRLTQVKRR